jgi:hypothetical protein
MVVVLSILLYNTHVSCGFTANQKYSYVGSNSISLIGKNVDSTNCIHDLGNAYFQDSSTHQL